MTNDTFQTEDIPGDIMMRPRWISIRVETARQSDLHSCEISNIEISWKHIGSGASLFKKSKVMKTSIICAYIICSSTDLRFSIIVPHLAIFSNPLSRAFLLFKISHINSFSYSHFSAGPNFRALHKNLRYFLGQKCTCFFCCCFWCILLT